MWRLRGGGKLAYISKSKSEPRARAGVCVWGGWGVTLRSESRQEAHGILGSHSPSPQDQAPLWPVLPLVCVVCVEPDNFFFILLIHSTDV